MVKKDASSEIGAENSGVRADIVVFMAFRRVWALPLVASALLGQQYPFVPVPNSPKNIERILQDKLGRLWMATHDDVVCFDGARFFSLLRHSRRMDRLCLQNLTQQPAFGGDDNA